MIWDSAIILIAYHLIASIIEVGNWLGLEDMKKENIFEWSDGTEISYFNWEEGQPDDKEHGDNCVILNNNPV